MNTFGKRLLILTMGVLFTGCGGAGDSAKTQPSTEKAPKVATLSSTESAPNAATLGSGKYVATVEGMS